LSSLNRRITELEHFYKQKGKRSSIATKNNVFILPDDEKRYQAFLRYAKKHPNEREWVAIILPAKNEIS
jgi:hypothetical protein